MAWNLFRILNSWSQLALVFLLIHYLNYGAEDQQKQVCLKPLIWHSELCLPFSARCYEISINLAIVHVLFAIILDYVLILIETKIQEERERNVGAIIKFVVLVVYFFALIPRFQVWYLDNQHLPLTLQTANLWEHNLAFTIIQAKFVFVFNGIVYIVGMYCLQNLDNLNNVIKGWNRHENGRITTFTILSMVTQSMLFIRLFLNIWSIDGKMADVKIGFIVQIVQEIYYGLCLSFLVTFLYKDEALQILDAGPCFSLMLMLGNLRFVYMRLFNDQFSDYYFMLHSFFFSTFCFYANLLIFTRLFVYVLSFLEDCISSLLNILNSMVPPLQQIHLSARSSKEDYYFNKRSQFGFNAKISNFV